MVAVGRIAGVISVLAAAVAGNLVRTEQPALAAACVEGTNYSVATSGNVKTVTVTSASGCTFDLPAGVTSVSYALVGGGGGGGGGVITGQDPGGSGGRGGQVVTGTTSVTSGATLTLTVGAGGSGGAATRNGVSGGITTMAVSGGTSLAAAGGNRGQKGSTRTNNKGSGGANGGKGGGSQNADAGGDGTLVALTSTTYGGGGGGGASSSKSAGSGGAGGGGGGGAAGSAGTAGTTNLGAGGGGGGGHASSAGAGGAGGRGVIVFQYSLDTSAPTVTLARSSSTSSSSTIFFTVSGDEAIRCSDLSAASDFTLTNMSIDSIQQTSSTVCTITGTSTATNDNVMVTSTVSASGGFSVRDLAGNAQTTLTSSPQSVNVTVPSSDTTAPTVRGVTSSTSDGAYKAGDIISLQVSFSELVIVTGTPTLTLETGSTDRAVNYTSGSGSASLTFEYTVQSGDTATDLDYVATTSLALAGGTIKDAANNVATLTLASPGATNSLAANKAFVIDTTGPTVSFVDGIDGTYYAEEQAAITVEFSENIVIAGTPTLQLETGTTDRLAYADGASATSLLMTYTVVCNDRNSSLDYLATSALTLSGGTITDAVGNAATLTLPGTGTSNSLAGKSNIDIDGRTLDGTASCSSTPSVTSVSSTTSDGSKNAGTSVSIQIAFDESVTVTGTPTLTLETGSTDRNASYASGSPGTTLTFTYTVQAGDASSDLDYTTTTALSGGTIVATTGGASADLTLPSPGGTGSLGANNALVIDTTSPSLSSFTPVDGATGVSVSSNVVLTFSESVTAVAGKYVRICSSTSSCTGSSVGGSVVQVFQASDTSKVSVSSATVTIDPADFGGSTTYYVSVDSGAFTDAAGNDYAGLTASTSWDFTTVSVDATAPLSSGSITVTVTNSTSVTVSYSATDGVSVASVAVYYSASAGLSSPVSCGSVTGLSGTSASGTLTCTLVSPSSGSTYYVYTRATDSSGNVEAAPGSADDSIVYDTTKPTVTWVEPATPSSSRTLNYSLQFSESVDGLAAADFSSTGTATGCSFTPASSSGTTISVTVVCTSDGSVVVRLDANSVEDSAGNTGPATNTAATSIVIDTSVPDTTAPTVQSVSATANGSYKAGGSVSIRVTFSETVTVSGNPRIALATGAVNRNATYSSGTGSNILVFTYSVQAGDSATDLDYAATTSLTLNSGSIKDAADNAATLTLPSPGAAGSLAANQSIIVDTTAPTVTITRSGSGTLGEGDTTTITFSLSEDATNFVVGDVTVTGGSLSGFSGSGDSYTATFTPTASSSGTATIAVAAAKFTDGADNDNAASSTLSIAYDTVPVTTSSSSSTTSSTTSTTVARSGGGGAATTTSTTSTSTTTTSTSTTTTTVPARTTGRSTTTTTVLARRVTICHATGSATNPYVTITVSVNATYGGHGNHDGDLIPAPAGGCPTFVRPASSTTTTVRAATTTTVRPTTTTTIRGTTTTTRPSTTSSSSTTTTIRGTTTTTRPSATSSSSSTTTTTIRGTTTTTRPGTTSSITTTTRPSTTSSSSSTTTTTIRGTTTTSRPASTSSSTTSSTSSTTLRPTVLTSSTSTSSSSTSTSLAGSTTSSSLSTTTLPSSTTTAFGSTTSSSSPTTPTTSALGTTSPDTVPLPTLPAELIAAPTTSDPVESQAVTGTTLPRGTNTVETSGRVQSLVSVGVTRGASIVANDPTGGANAFGIDRMTVKNVTLPQLEAERFGGFVPQTPLSIEVVGARTAGQFVVTPAAIGDTVAVAAALSESTDRLDADFAGIINIETIPQPSAEELDATSKALSSTRLMARVFVDSELAAPVRLADLDLPDSQRWVSITAEARGYSPGTVVYLALTSRPIVFAEAKVDANGVAVLTGAFPVEAAGVGAHRVRVVGIRQIGGVALGSGDTVQLSSSAIAEIARFDSQTSATVRITGPNVWGGLHSAVRIVPLRSPAPWWTIWLLAAVSLIIALAVWRRKLSGSRAKLVALLVLFVATVPSQYFGWIGAFYLVNGVGLITSAAAIAILWTVARSQRADNAPV